MQSEKDFWSDFVRENEGTEERWQVGLEKKKVGRSFLALKPGAVSRGRSYQFV